MNELMGWRLSPVENHRSATIVDHEGKSVARVYGGENAAAAIIKQRALAAGIVLLKEDLRLSLEHDRLTKEERFSMQERLTMLRNLIKRFELLPDVAGGVNETKQETA